MPTPKRRQERTKPKAAGGRRGQGIGQGRSLGLGRLTPEEEKAKRKILRLPVVQRPVTRADCTTSPRPCPFVGCRHHLYTDLTHGGALKLNFPHLEPWQLEETCSLDVAERGGADLEDVGELLNITLERTRQIQVEALGKVRLKVDEQARRRKRLKSSSKPPAPPSAKPGNLGLPGSSRPFRMFRETASPGVLIAAAKAKMSVPAFIKRRADSGERFCLSCLKWRPQSTFYAGGAPRPCRDCCNAVNRQRYEENPERQKRSGRTYYKAHRDQILERAKTRYKERIRGG